MGIFCVFIVVDNVKPFSLFESGEDVLSALEVSDLNIKQRKIDHYSSQPFLKPTMSLFEVIVCKLRKFTLFRRLRTEVCSSQQNNVSDKGAVKEVALQLNRTLKGQAVSLLPSILSDHWSIDDCRDAILRWADELQHLQLKAEQTQAEPNTSSSTAAERRMVSASSSPNDREEERLREAQLTLKQWANSLKALPEGSVSLGTDVGGVLEDLDKQWRRGQLPNMLPALEVIVRSVMQSQQRPEVVIPMKWICKPRKSYSGWGNTGWRPSSHSRFLTTCS
ncbi:uncharacterized protein LOC105895686 [Clupea harengus]|uniref:Uncharacterized protein LOC105895686 n=1 Tax=Clupea harengus TaxID=7950 RepID=A0A6P8GFY2_CLUHA|nr:uncharacterized protein LOC105895686 [Clupea harengus]